MHTCTPHMHMPTRTSHSLTHDRPCMLWRRKTKHQVEDRVKAEGLKERTFPILHLSIESSPGGFLKESGSEPLPPHCGGVPWTVLGCYSQIFSPKYQILTSRCSCVWYTDLVPTSPEHTLEPTAAMLSYPRPPGLGHLGLARVPSCRCPGRSS